MAIKIIDKVKLNKKAGQLELIEQEVRTFVSKFSVLLVPQSSSILFYCASSNLSLVKDCPHEGSEVRIRRCIERSVAEPAEHLDRHGVLGRRLFVGFTDLLWSV